MPARHVGVALTDDDVLLAYQARYCRPCGAGCAVGGVEMLVCIKARLAASSPTPAVASRPATRTSDSWPNVQGA